MKTMELNELHNGIRAYAMDMHIRNLIDDIGDDECELYYEWLEIGVPDGSNLVDCIDYYGLDKKFDELLKDYLALCKRYKTNPSCVKEIKEIQKNINEMLDNPYYNMV